VAAQQVAAGSTPQVVQASAQRVTDTDLWLPASQLIDKQGLNVAIFGYPGSGKSTLSATGPKPLVVDIDGTAIRSLSDRSDVQIAEVPGGPAGYDHCMMLSDRLLNKAHDFQLINWDTITTLHGMALKKVMKASPTPDMPSQPEYGKANAMIEDFVQKWCAAARERGIHVMFSVHVKEEKDGDSGPMMIRMGLTPGSTLAVYRAVDTIGYLSENTKTSDRKLLLKNNGKVIAKHHQPRTGENRLPDEVVNPNLTEIINIMQGRKQLTKG